MDVFIAMHQVRPLATDTTVTAPIRRPSTGTRSLDTMLDTTDTATDTVLCTTSQDSLSNAHPNVASLILCVCVQATKDTDITSRRTTAT